MRRCSLRIFCLDWVCLNIFSTTAVYNPLTGTCLEPRKAQKVFTAIQRRKEYFIHRFQVKIYVTNL